MGLVAPLRWNWKSGRIGVPADRLAEAHDAFLVDLDEEALAHAPEDAEALMRLGATYTRMGRHEDGLAIDRRLVALLPEDETAQYNLACSLALTGHADAAFAALETAVDCGYSDAVHLQADEDLESLHEDPRFDALVARLQDQ